MKTTLQRKQRRLSQLGGNSGKIPRKAGKSGLQSIEHQVERRKEDSPSTREKREARGPASSFRCTIDCSTLTTLVFFLPGGPRGSLYFSSELPPFVPSFILHWFPVAQGQLWLENIKQKIPEINNSCFKLYTVLSSDEISGLSNSSYPGCESSFWSRFGAVKDLKIQFSNMLY